MRIGKRPVFIIGVFLVLFGAIYIVGMLTTHKQASSSDAPSPNVSMQIVRTDEGGNLTVKVTQQPCNYIVVITGVAGTQWELIVNNKLTASGDIKKGIPVKKTVQSTRVSTWIRVTGHKGEQAYTYEYKNKACTE